ncbi:mediator complex subunit [Actinomortierella wolfii]|nr:mediator complex subunit [Actinomortierella wolfii]
MHHQHQQHKATTPQPVKDHTAAPPPPLLQKMEPNGVPKGASVVPSPPVLEQQQQQHASTNASGGLTPTLPPQPPQLPTSLQGMVPLGLILHRMANEAFADLSNLSEILPSMTDPQRKLHMLEYALAKREQFIKLLVLVKWAKNAADIQQCQNIIGFLQQENEHFTRAVGGIFETYKTFGQARVRNYDIPTAVDVLTTGTYQRLPSIIKTQFIPPETPTPRETAASLEKLDDVMRMRLLCEELVPPGMTYTVANGKAKFRVENEFEVSLTVQGPGSPQQVPWHIVALKILVKPVGGSFRGFSTTLNEGQLRAITHIAQQELMPRPPAIPPAQQQQQPQQQSGTASTPGTPSTSPSLNNSLCRMYDYLHMLCLQLQIELIYIQAAQLLRSGWSDRLRLEVNQARTMVRLVYWSSGSTQPPMTAPVLPATKRRTSAIASAAAAAAAQAREAALAQQENYLEIKIEEFTAGKQTVIPPETAGALVDPKILGYPKAKIEVVWSQVVKGVVNKADLGDLLDLDASNLNIERLLLRVAGMHARQIMQNFYTRLWTYVETAKNAKDKGSSRAHFTEDDIKLEDIEAHHGSVSAADQQESRSSSSLARSQALLIRFRGERWVRIRVDVRTGRVVAREVGKGDEGDDPIIATFQARLNENVSNIVDALISLRFSMAIVELESKGVRLGLQPYRKLAISKEEMARFGDNIQHMLFLQYPQHPHFYLAIGVIAQHFHVWMIETKALDREAAGVWMTLASVQPVYWQNLKKPRRESNYGGITMTRSRSKRRLSLMECDEPALRQTLDKSEEESIDQDMLAKLSALCRIHIQHQFVKAQFDLFGINYRYLTPPAKDDGQRGSRGLLSAMGLVPFLRIDPCSVAPGIEDDLLQYASATFSGWWENQRGSDRFVVEAKPYPNIIPPKTPTKLGDHIQYSPESNVVTFTYDASGDFVAQFIREWRAMARMLRITRQVQAATNNGLIMQLQSWSFNEVVLSYHARYTVAIRWRPPASEGHTSTTGVMIPVAPRFKNGMYQLRLGELPCETTAALNQAQPTVSSTNRINPHRRMKYFLEDLLNRECDLPALVNTMIETCPLLEVLDVLEQMAREDNMGTKIMSIVPRSAHHIRVIYGAMYALDIKAYNRTHISIFDASYPTESFDKTLPPPPAPALSPALESQSSQGSVAPTTKGHLNYIPIPNLLGIVGSMDLDRDEDFETNIGLSMFSQGYLSENSHIVSKAFAAATAAAAAAPAASSTSLQQQQQQQILRRLQLELEGSKMLMPLPHGVVCSRAVSARVVYRIAKHIETLLQHAAAATTSTVAATPSVVATTAS